MTAIPYTTPQFPLILTVSSFLSLINVAEAVFARFINAGLLGSLCMGILFGPEISSILSEAIQSTFITLGYIGLLLIVFEAGLSTNISLFFDNILLSCAIAISGMILPVALSMLLLCFGFGYPPLQAFAAGAALSSTSLGTTLTVLQPEYRQTRTGTVLMAAALLDDIGGLVIAGILAQLASYGASSTPIPWYIVVRPILVSFGFGFGVPFFAFISRYIIDRAKVLQKWGLFAPNFQLFILVVTLSGFVAGAKYAGTSELFGGYLAGAYLAYVFGHPGTTVAPPVLAFHTHIMPMLQVLFSPLFFASIGSALPIRSLGSVNGSSRVVWRGLVYSLLMASGHGWFGRPVVRRVASITNDDTEPPASSEPGIPELDPGFIFTRTRSAALVGLAMIARGEIALIVAEIARPLLVVRGSSEPFAIVIWATLLNTAAGAILVGFLLKKQKPVVVD
ncbi:Cation/H+ exchanger [Mycena alexandri]|uniref:Cation/H+ exchanger n=1 Tax=Mycena alexandri TaxID=1745969 RepID=A0AAD6WL15_9AGAR|nr:Cation/H+ exchanger [Mycena alexandri]